MKLNAFKVATFVLALASLLLPWISYSLLLSDRANFTTHLTSDSSPSFSQFSLVRFQNNTLETYNSAPSYHLPLFPTDLLFYTLVAGWRAPYYDFVSMTHGIFGFSVCFVIVALFATSTWKSAAKRVFLTPLFVLIFGTIFSLAAQIWSYKMVSENWVIASRAAAINFGNEEVFYVDSIVLNVGFFLAVLSILSFVLSYLSPKPVSLPIGLDTRITQTLKAHWLVVPDRERVPAIFLTTFLVSYSLVLITYFFGL